MFVLERGLNFDFKDRFRAKMPDILYDFCRLPRVDGEALSKRVTTDNMQMLLGNLLIGNVSLLEDVALSAGLETDFLNPYRVKAKLELQRQYGFSKDQAGCERDGPSCRVVSQLTTTRSDLKVIFCVPVGIQSLLGICQ